MIARSITRCIALAWLALSLAIAPARASVLAAGSAEGAWVITSTPLGAVALIFIDPERPGVGLTVASFTAPPVALAAGKDCVVAAFGAEQLGARSIRPMRITSIEPGPNGLQVFSRARALPPLPTGAPLGSLAVVGTTVIALTVSPQGLWACDGPHWHHVTLPEGAREWSSVWVVDYLGRAGICAVDAAGRGTLWTADPISDAETWAWTRADIAVPANTRSIIRVSSHLVAATPSSDGATLTLSLLRPEDPIERARIDTTSAETIVAPLGDRMLIATPGKTEPLRLDVRIIGLDGKSAFEGPLKSASPLSSEDVQLVVLGVMGIVLAAMMFALRSDGHTVPRLPEGTVLAPPRRRLWATLIDLIPGIAAGWAVGSWQLTAGEHADPIITGIAAGFLASLLPAVIGEALTGRTIGKALLSLRTVGPDGRNPTWPQALGRNLSKFLYPPLGLLILMNPAATTPGSCGTLVVMDRPKSGDSTTTAPPADR